MYSVYAIYNKKHNKIYIWQTLNINNRVREHNDVNNKTHAYTWKFDGNWILIYEEDLPNRKKALVREKQLKSYRGRQFVKQHIPLQLNGRAASC